MVFASLIIERDPLSLAELPGAVLNWVQVAGLIAAVLLLAYWLAKALGQAGDHAVQQPRGAYQIYLSVTCGLSAAYLLVMLLVWILSAMGASFLQVLLPSGQRMPQRLGDYVLAVNGGLALLAVLGPFVVGLRTLSWRRIWALARVSLKEAVRRRVVHVFGAMALIFLFADWFVPFKAENQIRNYVRVLYWSMTPLFLMVATLLGAFGIPNDVKNQSIHTIVTKPVEKFEIVLGRFLGYAILLTVGLAGLTAMSLIYVVRGVHPDAAQESYRARVPLFGKLSFQGTPQSDKGLNVGRTFDYRSYISGPNPQNPNRPRQYAIWTYAALPGYLGDGDQPVRFEFTFDIFRLLKGEEGKPILCDFMFADGRVAIADLEARLVEARKSQDQRLSAAQRKNLAKADYDREKDQIKSDLAYEYGLHGDLGVKFTDYHTQHLEVPAGLFKKLNEIAPEVHGQAKGGAPRFLQIVVAVNREDPSSRTQMLGVARRDLYLLAADNPFWLNFVKGVIGMWFSFLLLLGVAISLSTYLSGVISWLTTLFLYGAGLRSDFIAKLTGGRLQGGGPAEAFYRLTTGRVTGAQLDDSTTTVLLRGTDEVYRWFLRLFQNLLPDVNRFDLHQYVANGFDIPWGQVLLLDTFVPLVGYLLPWAVLAYYLIKFREIANPT